MAVSKRVSFQQLTTRRHYPGAHCFQAFVNGQAMLLGEVVVTD